MWFLISLIGPSLYASTNLIDKLILVRNQGTVGVRGIVTLSALASAALAVLAWVMGGQVALPLVATYFQLTLIGFLNFLVLVFYLTALAEEEPSKVVVHYSLTALFSSILGWLFLGEVLSTLTWAGIALIVVGSASVSGLSLKNLRGHSLRTALLMSSASFTWSLSAVLFKLFALELDFWTVILWENIALSLLGAALFLIWRDVRQWTTEAISGRTLLLLLIAINEAIFLMGNLAVAFALTIAPVALVLLANAFQPFFVLVLAYVVHKFLGMDLVEDTAAPALVRKLISIALAGSGVFLVTQLSNVS